MYPFSIDFNVKKKKKRKLCFRQVSVFFWTETKVLLPSDFCFFDRNLNEWMQTKQKKKHRNEWGSVSFSFSPSGTEERNGKQNVSVDLALRVSARASTASQIAAENVYGI